MKRRTFLSTGAAVAGGTLFAAQPVNAQGTPAQGSRDAIRQRKKLVAGIKADTPPFGFLDKSNQLVGFDIDLVREVAKALSVELELVRVTSPTRIPMLVSAQVDLVAASMTHTRERDRTIDFSITYYTGAQTLLVPESSKIGGLSDLAGKTVALQQGTTLEKNLTAAAPTASQLAFRDYNSAWLALRQGRADAFTGSYDVLRGFAAANPGFRITGERFSVEPFGIGVRQGDSDMRDLINEVLQDLWESKRYAETYKRWFEIEPAVAIEMWPK
ncbi:MAG: transporter substrate-binding domain-containing protein [Proteobacteria bacterium]|nr:transporter substrate-binding domain-containing protein [Pseudomonadota bacterium]